MMQNTDVDVSSRRQELQAKIEEMEDTLRALREQLRAEEQSMQHEAIDNLEEYLGECDNKYENLRAFWHVLRKEWRDLLDRKHRDGEDN